MKKISIFLLSMFMILGSSSAQNFVADLNSKPLVNRTKAPETVRILAIMVEFQEDNYDGTFGNGKFGTIYSEDYGNEILDPLPHDSEYFENHLEFAKNYWNKVSNSQLNIEYNVLPEIITVSQAMRNYSPPLNSDSLDALGFFSQEVWRLTVEKYTDINFSDYDLFAIFHAGVGRDINTPGSLGIERDLPSVYLGTKTLRDIFGNDFHGFPANGTNPITNTMILPETESRELEGIGGTVLLELTINGLIVANIASHLGLPDLFDTETGLSAIGRFGLMDGQAIFSYNGAFPPEPSPWEKIQLGWEEPIVVDDPGKIDLSVNSSYGDTTLIKIPINSTEYYLVENRNRDTENDGAVITYKLGNQTFTESYDRDTTGFYSYDTDTLKGVIVDVDQFDWALPGSGIVIWHIDEKIIEEKLASNSINNDAFNRGVDVEEADGIQDIGEEFNTILGETVIGEGTEEDFWFASNEAELYQNKFTPETKPNTNSNSGANSLIRLEEFSDISNKMSFQLYFADEAVSLRTFKKLSIPSEVKYITELETDTSNTFYFTSENKLYVSDVSGNILEESESFSSKKPAAVFHNEQKIVIGTIGSSINLLVNDDIQNIITLSLNSEITAHPVIANKGNDKILLIGTSIGVLYSFSLNSILSGNSDTASQENIFDGNPVLQICAKDFPTGDFIAAVSQNEFWDNSGNSETFSDKILKCALSNDFEGNDVAVILNANNIFNIVNSGKGSYNFSVEGSSINNFSLGKFDDDEKIYISVSQDDLVKVLNLSGFPLDNFPFSDDESSFNGMPLTSNGRVISYSIDGNLFSFNPKGNISNSFPLTTGSQIAVSPVLFEDKGITDAISDNSFGIAAVTNDNYFYVWNLTTSSNSFYWSEEFSNNYNDSFLEGPVEAKITEYFPQERAYNWPNPVYEGETYIRYFVSEDSDVRVTIFDLSGELVAELSQMGRGGLDNEITWNVEDVPSGVYFAHINASGSGKEDTKIIKIAVIK